MERREGPTRLLRILGDRWGGQGNNFLLHSISGKKRGGGRKTDAEDYLLGRVLCLNCGHKVIRIKHNAFVPCCGSDNLSPAPSESGSGKSLQCILEGDCGSQHLFMPMRLGREISFQGILFVALFLSSF